MIHFIKKIISALFGMVPCTDSEKHGLPYRLCVFFWTFFILSTLFMPFCFFHGFPLPLGEHSVFRMKDLRKLFELSFTLFILGAVVHPRRREVFALLKKKAEAIAESKQTIWILAGVYFFLFLWQQATKVFALEINFIPFLFFDYMLWYFNQAKFCFTGLLHGFYHLNLILLLLFPIWKIFKSPWLLHITEPLIASFAVVPFYLWAKDHMKNGLLALTAAFVYLNFRYLQNVLMINFVVEVFYPLFIFSAVYFASGKKEILYYLSILLGFLVKEDSAIYFGALGAFFLFLPGYRRRGWLTITLSIIYPIFLLKFWLPWSGNTILKDDLRNYAGHGRGLVEIVFNFLKTPWVFVHGLFLPVEKTRTLFKLTSRLLFFPLLSPWFLLVIVSLYPVFFQSSGDNNYFYSLSFHYAAAVLPFVFLAFVDGWKRIEQTNFFQKKSWLRPSVIFALILFNGMNLRPLHFTWDDLKTIRLAKTLPPDKIVVAQGHLVPYLGYRKWNFYISDQYGIRKDTREAYLNPDYFLFDFKANAYPLTPEELRAKAEVLKKDGRWRVFFEDDRRLLLKKKI